MTTKPFRFGVVAAGSATPSTLLATARQAETAGYDTLLLRDHLVSDPFGPQLAPLVALTAVAAATPRVRVGTMVLANDFRHPAVLAKEAATLHTLSGGRFELGIGAGWLREEYAAAGLTFDSAGTRIARLGASVQILKQLLRGDVGVSGGTPYPLQGLTNYPPPDGLSPPPLLLGGGAQRMLTLAGAEADIVSVMNSSVASGVLQGSPDQMMPAAVEEKLGWIREGAGARFPALELSMVVDVTVTDDRDEAARAFARERGWDGLAAATVLVMPSVFIGSVAEIAQTMTDRRDRFGISYLTVADASLREVAPIVASLAGS